MDKLARILLILLSLFGTIFGGRLSLAQFQVGDTCPAAGPIPACYLVFAGYLIILLSTIFRGKLKTGRVFFIGWVPVFALAAFGVSMELTGNHICPVAGGVPQCFYSLALITICLLLYLFYNRSYAK